MDHEAQEESAVNSDNDIREQAKRAAHHCFSLIDPEYDAGRDRYEVDDSEYDRRNEYIPSLSLDDRKDDLRNEERRGTVSYGDQDRPQHAVFRLVDEIELDKYDDREYHNLCDQGIHSHDGLLFEEHSRNKGCCESQKHE